MDLPLFTKSAFEQLDGIAWRCEERRMAAEQALQLDPQDAQLLFF